MDMPAGIAVAPDRVAPLVDSRAIIAHDVLDQHGRDEAYQAPGPSNAGLCPQTTQDVHPSPDLRA